MSLNREIPHTPSLATVFLSIALFIVDELMLLFQLVGYGEPASHTTAGELLIWAAMIVVALATIFTFFKVRFALWILIGITILLIGLPMILSAVYILQNQVS